MGKRVNLSLKQKISLLNDFRDNSIKRKELSVKYKIDVSTVSKIIKNEENIRNLALSSNWKSKRQRKGEHPNVEKALAVWFDEMRGQNAIVTSSMLVNKAKELGIQMNEEFEPDYSWLFRWRRRFNINFNLVQRETSKNDNLEVDDFSSMVLPNLLNEYSPDCVFNAKESGLYYKALPNTRYFKKGDQPNACKSQKSRLTLLFVCNSTGSYKQVFCIGKPKKSISFKYKNLPITYYSNKYAWMTNVIWNEILSIIDKEMQENNMKILLFIDNAACHKVTIPLENIKIHFLPRNNTALKQPLDQGIINCFKYQYRKIIVTKQLCALKKGLTTNEYIKSVTIFDALNFIKRGWWLITPETIANCFKKAGFNDTAIEHIECDDEANEIENFSLEYLHCDDDLICYGVMADEEIFENATENDLDANDEFFVVEKQFSSKEILNALDVLQHFCSEQNINTNFLFEEIEDIFIKNDRKLKQSKINDFLK